MRGLPYRRRQSAVSRRAMSTSNRMETRIRFIRCPSLWFALRQFGAEGQDVLMTGLCYFFSSFNPVPFSSERRFRPASALSRFRSLRWLFILSSSLFLPSAFDDLKNSSMYTPKEISCPSRSLRLLDESFACSFWSFALSCSIRRIRFSSVVRVSFFSCADSMQITP